MAHESVQPPPQAAPLAEVEPKVKILPGMSSDMTAATFVIDQEDHTLGNTLRHCIMQNPEVEFCGYSIPHPSNLNIHIRIQTTPNTTALEALSQGLKDLYTMCDHTLKKFNEEITKGDYEIVSS
ncbi:RNA polymerase subunit AC19 [Dimargaris cristalligena]|uniref:DNA-directed RNA polymerases I and III subunit RPAC2 n=1 Tax=Dimargaris cristalligena TaxID=215637 RepID=A0A4P9ZR62_9FUNG|nr:RNA polymerase subunit AC19 [Dimargaris cristalligena]RKP35877.1 DNA-directed RNA polymerases I and III 16 kDa polypeptide [Dimargaris cristalligena]|eukprot:RKP35877.1 DNA-directed RNA polymerases I and III 16 kDa polypeptide [Dimargaris cristalligena]